VARVNKLKTLIREKQATYKRRTGKHLPQNVMAVEMGIDPATLSQYMNDKVGSVNWDVWEKLANYFDVAGHEIFEVHPDKK
jgi:transcriptional regulator with XRE-family HTH domain